MVLYFILLFLVHVFIQIERAEPSNPFFVVVIINRYLLFASMQLE